MREPPPRELVERLERLGLATPAQILGVSGLARRLARGLPRLESVWIDALAQARVLTPLQADQLRSGTGEDLRIGPYVLQSRLSAPSYLEAHRARHLPSGDDVRLTTLTPPNEALENVARQAEQLVAKVSSLTHPGLLPVYKTGVAGPRVWLAGPHIAGTTVAERVIGRGRFPAAVVLEVARQMTATLVTMEDAGFRHGDIGARTVLIDPTGGVKLLDAGLREIAHPDEGFDFADLLPEDYDYLAPERVVEGTPTSSASDLYACGCLWWQMLTGRPPLSGGSSRAKLRSVASPKIEEIRYLAPDTPPTLAEAIHACLSVDPAERPPSAANVVEELGEPARGGRALAAAACRVPLAVRSPWSKSLTLPRQLVRTPFRLGAMVAAAVALVAILWGLRQYDPALPPHQIAQSGPAEATSTDTTVSPGPAPDSQQELAKEPSVPVAPAPEAMVAVPPPPPEPVGTRPPVPIIVPRELVLDGTQPVDGRRLQLVPQTHVRAAPGSRATLQVFGEGILVAVDGVLFEDIDFLWTPDAGTAGATSYGAMIRLAGEDLRFARCTFRVAHTGGSAAVVRAAGIEGARRQPTTGRRLEWVDSVVLSADALVMLVAGEVASVRLSNVLYLASGPVVHLGGYPNAESPIGIQLANVTLRDAGPVVACDVMASPGPPGALAVQADQCALVPPAGVPLLAFRGPAFREELLQGILWTGQGSLVSPDGAIVGRVGAGSSLEVLDDANVSIAGLVRGEVEFAGEASRGPDASRIERWQVPLRSASPPGVNSRRLPPFPVSEGE